MRGRREAIYALEALRGFMPGCEHAKLRNFGMTLGVRDTRKIDALYNLTGTDVREQGRFDDAIGIFPEFIDGFGILILPTTGRYFQIPYRSLLPKKVKNLLVAGRAAVRALAAVAGLAAAVRVAGLLAASVVPGTVAVVFVGTDLPPDMDQLRGRHSTERNLLHLMTRKNNGKTAISVTIGHSSWPGTSPLTIRSASSGDAPRPTATPMR